MRIWMLFNKQVFLLFFGIENVIYVEPQHKLLCRVVKVGANFFHSIFPIYFYYLSSSSKIFIYLFRQKFATKYGYKNSKLQKNNRNVMYKNK
jgi:hypothetical protein